MSALAEATGESASLFVSDGVIRFCLLRVDSKQSVRHTAVVGEPLPLNSGASGQIINIFSGGASTITEKSLKKIPTIHVGTGPLDVSSIAVPIFGVGGDFIGAITVSGPASRFDIKARKRATRRLMDVMKVLTAELGGDPLIFKGT